MASAVPCKKQPTSGLVPWSSRLFRARWQSLRSSASLPLNAQPRFNAKRWTMTARTDVDAAHETSRRPPLLGYFLLAVAVFGTIAVFAVLAFLAPEHEPGHRSPQSCIDRGGEMQAVSRGLFGGGSRAICLFPDGTTFNIIPHVEFVDMRSETE